jgi:hypothetical protein
MKKIYLLAFALLYIVFIPNQSVAQNFCDSTGNVVIFSNYDGGTLNINVDMNIPNLKIGICGYENDSIILSGTYLGNVSQVIFAGYYNSNNVHCTPWPSVKSINGVPSSITQINFAPPSTFSNPFGYQYIICNYSCDVNSNQGGCNTADQIADYFFYQFSSTNLLFHYTQYGCWNGTYSLSDGGNCCAVPIGTNAPENSGKETYSVNNYSDSKFIVTGLSNLPASSSRIEVLDLFGHSLIQFPLYASRENIIDLSGSPKGIYLLKIYEGKKVVTQKIVLQ